MSEFSRIVNKLINEMSYQERCEMNKKLFGYETFEGHLCHVSIEADKQRIAELEKRYPSEYILRKLEYWKKDLAMWEERAKNPGAI